MDVLRDNIGLLQPINEFSFPWSKKPTRWQRFKNFVGRNKGKMALGALGLGAGYVGRSRYTYNKMKNAIEKSFADKGYVYNKEKDHWSKQMNKGDVDTIKAPTSDDGSFHQHLIDKGYKLDADKKEYYKPAEPVYHNAKVIEWNPLKQY